jgi:hypothetical protein
LEGSITDNIRISMLIQKYHLISDKYVSCTAYSDNQHQTASVGEDVCKAYVSMQELPCALPDQQSPSGALRLLAREESMERFGECGIRFARHRGGFDP